MKIGYTLRHHAELSAEAAKKRWSHAEFLRRVIEAETHERQARALERRLRAARFPVRKSLDQFRWDCPHQINEPQVRHLFELGFAKEHTNVVFCGGVGLGKSNLATALGYAACQAGHAILFTTAVDALNALVAAQAAHRLHVEFKKYLAPAVLILDVAGYLPLDKSRADLLFQIVSQRYERGSLIVTTNKAYKHWAGIFNNDAGITAAILDRLLHRATTVVIEGSSYRMKDRNPEEPLGIKRKPTASASLPDVAPDAPIKPHCAVSYPGVGAMLFIQGNSEPPEQVLFTPPLTQMALRLGSSETLLTKKSLTPAMEGVNGFSWE